MANGADGSVKIDTGLDSSGVEMGAKEVEQRVKSLCSAVDKLGAKFQRSAAGYASNIGEILSREYTDGIEGVKAKLHDLGEAQIPTDGYKQVCDDIAKAEAELNKLNAKAQKMQDLGTNQPSKAWQKVQQDIDDTISKLDDLKAKLGEAKEDYAFMNTSEQKDAAHSEGPEGWAAYVSELERLKQYISTSEKEVATLEAQLEKLLAKQEQLRASGADEGSSQWRSLQYDIEKVTEKLEALRAEQERFQADGSAYMSGSQTEEYQQLSAELERLQGAMGQPAAQSNVLAGALNGLGRAMSSVANHALSLGKRLAQIGFKAVAKGAKKGISALKSFSAQTNKTTLTTNGLVRSLTSLKRLLITRIKRMFISSIFNNVREGLTALEGYSSRFKKVMDSLRGSAKAAAGNISVAIAGLVTAIAPVLQYLINLLNTVLSLINQVFALLGGRSTYTVARNGLSGVSSGAGAVANSAKSAGTAAKGASGGLQKMSASANNSAEALSNAADAQKGLNGEMYSYDELTHKDKKNTAASNAEDYAKAANDAADAQKDFNAELYGYDELTRQNKQNGGGGGGGGGGGITFEEQPIDLPEAVVDWIERLKEAWQSGDWYGVGKVVAEGLNKAMDVVDNWINTKFRPIAVEWASRIAKILNGLIDGLDWKKLGKTLADGINAIFDAANTFLSTVNWLTLGRRISDAIKSWFDNVDWALVGKTFANKWNALIQTIRGIVTNQEMWTSIGTSIGQFVKSWFSTIDINSIAGILIGVLNGVTSSIKAFLSQNPFDGVAEKISSAVNRVIHEVDWAALGKSLSDLFLAALNVLHDVVKKIDWHGIGVAIGEFLGSIDWAGVFATLADTIWTAFKGVLEGLFSTSGGRVFLGILAGVKGLGAAFTLGKAALLPKILGFNTLGSQLVTSIGLGITGAIAGFGVYFAALQDALTNGLNWLNGVMIPVGSTIAGAGVGAIIGSLGGPIGAGIGALVGLAVGLVTDGIVLIKEHWTEITAWITEKWNAFSGWISGAWNNLATFAGNAWNTISNAITTAFDAAVSWVKQAATDLGNWISTTWTNITTWTSTAWNTITTAVTTAFDAAVNWVKQAATDVGNWISTTWTNIVTWTTTAWNTITTAVTTAFDAAVNWVKQAATDLGNWISTTWTNITTWTSTAWNNVTTTVTTAFGDAKNWVVTTATAIGTQISTTWTNITTWTSTAWNNVTTAISTAFTNAKTAVVNTANQIGTQITTTWNNVKSWTSTAWNNVKTTVTTTFNNAKSAVVSTANTLKSNLSSAWNSIKSTASSAWNSIKSTATSAWSSLSSTVSSKWQALKSTLGSVNFSSVGKALVDGLKNGVGGAWQSLVSKAQSLAQGLIAKFKSWFSIGSPSKVFAEIGGFLDAGMEQGIMDGEGKLLHTAGNVAEAVTNGMTPDSPKVTMTAEGVVGSMQAVISGLSTIAETFQTIANTLTSMGGLQVPQIAAGTVVPYKTKVDSNTPAEDESDPVEGYLSGIDRALQTLIELIRANGQRDSTVKVLIDGREVFTTVVNENNRAIRRTGTSPIRV